jgi:hypothetical protein
MSAKSGGSGVAVGAKRRSGAIEKRGNEVRDE